LLVLDKKNGLRKTESHSIINYAYIVQLFFETARGDVEVHDAVPHGGPVRSHLHRGRVVHSDAKEAGELLCLAPETNLVHLVSLEA
jgi:hypothetical protein